MQRKRLLLHCCCAPCASYVITELLPTFDVTLYFYNPNIEPYVEYKKRKDELVRLASIYSSLFDKEIKMEDDSYDNEMFAIKTSSYESEKEGGERCRVCFDIRLGETAARAKALGYDIFATTLSVSPHKNAATLNDCGIKQSAEHNISYLLASSTDCI